jgi:alkylated DNA nucleotide flippase Atl1
MKTSTRKTWRQKLEDSKGLPRIVDAPTGPRSGPYSPGRLLIPSPLKVDAAIRTIPQGQTRTAPQLREEMARLHNAESTCPLVTGIFSNIVAHAAEEAALAGDAARVTPWWRVLTKDGRPNPKFPGAPHEQLRRLHEEGVDLPMPPPRKATRKSQAKP